MKNITISGNVTKDAEVRTTQSGTKVVGFSVAVNGFKNGEKTSHFFDVSIWGKRGENAVRFATKGAKISVTGDFGTREHNGKTYLTLEGSDFTPMGGGQQQGNQQPSGGYGQDQSGGYGDPARQAPARDLDDEIPF